MKSPRSLMTVAALAIATWTTAQSLPFRSYSSDDGLAQSVVLALCQDEDGFLWVGTPYGLSRFDGREFVNMAESDGVTDNVIRSLLLGEEGSLLVGTDSGLSDYREGRWSIPYPELEPHSIRALARGPDGVLWAGTYGAGVARIEKGEVRFLDTKDGLGNNRVRAACADSRGRILLGTYGGGVSIVNQDGTIDSFGEDHGLKNPFVRSIFELEDGRVLVGTNRGVFVFDKGEFCVFEDAATLSEVSVTSILRDHRQRLWFGTGDNGACVLEGGTLRCYRQRHGLPDASVNCIIEDNERNLWFGTYGGGVSRLTTESFRNYTTVDGLPPGNVQAFAEAPDGIWIGTHGGGITLVRDNSLTTLTSSDGLPHDKVFSLTRDHRGRLWVGTLGGACVLEDDQFTVFGEEDGLANDIVYWILPQHDGTIWFATLRGLTRRDPEGNYETFTTEQGLPGNRVHHVIESRKGGLFLGTSGGLGLYKDGVISTVLTIEDGLPNNFINWLYERADGTLWIATTHGLVRYDGRDVLVLTTEDGLSHNKISVILEDRAGRLWVGTTRGVNILDNGEITVFTSRQGLPSSEVLPSSGFRESSGRMWFGTVGGATVFETDAGRSEPPPPPIHISRFEVEGTDRFRSDVRVFDYHDNSLRFEFVAPSLGQPDDVVYRYQLRGLDSVSRTTAARFADYPAVPPGNYEFSVRASHEGRRWSPQAATFGFEITPPYWQETWFRIAVVLTLACVGFTAHAYRMRAIHQRGEELEALVSARTAEVRAERREVKQKNEQLRVIDRIVVQINRETDFSTMLDTILGGVGAFLSSRTAMALVRDEEDAGFRAVTHHDWLGLPPGNPLFSHDLIRSHFITPARPVGKGLFHGSAERTATDGSLGRIPPEFLSVVIDLDGEPAGYLVFGFAGGTSVSEHHIEALLPLREHLRSAFVKGQLVRRLRELNAKKNEFLGIAAHDLRSPLGGVISYTSLLLRFLDENHMDPEKWRRFLNNIHITADQMLSMVTKLLDVSAIESGRVDLHIERCKMAEILEERCSLLRDSADEKDISLTVDPAHTDSEVEVDRMRIGEVLDNLVSNAIKFTPAGGHVRVFCEPGNPGLITHVQDDGIGLHRNEVDGAFYGKKLSARPTGGESSTGFGLVIVKKLVELHGGQVWLTSQKQVGSTFSFSLPERYCEVQPEASGSYLRVRH